MVGLYDGGHRIRETSSVAARACTRSEQSTKPAAAVEQVRRDPDGASRAARGCTRVLRARRRTAAYPRSRRYQPPANCFAAAALSDDLVLEPVARRPLTLPTDTTDRVPTTGTPAVPGAIHETRSLRSSSSRTTTSRCSASVWRHCSPLQLRGRRSRSSCSTTAPRPRRCSTSTCSRPSSRPCAVHSGTNIGFAAAGNAGNRGDLGAVRGHSQRRRDRRHPAGSVRSLPTSARRHRGGWTVHEPNRHRVGNTAHYCTYGEMVRSADERRRGFAGKRTVVDMLPMFCLALGAGSSIESAPWTSGTGSVCLKTTITPAACTRRVFAWPARRCVRPPLRRRLLRPPGSEREVPRPLRAQSPSLRVEVE